jgi:hypothetical protein
VAGDGWDAPRLVKEIGAQGILALPIDSRHVRMVTHYGVTDTGVDRTLRVASKLLG